MVRVLGLTRGLTFQGFDSWQGPMVSIPNILRSFDHAINPTGISCRSCEMLELYLDAD